MRTTLSLDDDVAQIQLAQGSMNIRVRRLGLTASKQPVRKPFRVKPWNLGLPAFEKVEELLEYLEGPDHR